MNGVSSASAGPSKTSMTKSPASVTSVGKSRGVPPANEPRTYSYVAELVVWARWLLQCFRSNTGRARALREAAGTVRSAHLAVCTDDSQ